MKRIKNLIDMIIENTPSKTDVKEMWSDKSNFFYRLVNALFNAITFIYKRLNNYIHRLEKEPMKASTMLMLLVGAIGVAFTTQGIDAIKLNFEQKHNPIMVQASEDINRVNTITKFEKERLGFDDKDLNEDAKNGVELNTDSSSRDKKSIKVNKTISATKKHPKVNVNNLIKNPQTQQAKFINEVAPFAYKVAKEQGLFPSVMIAQAVVESDSGRSGLSANYHNYFGIKGSWNDPENSVIMPTQEYYTSTPVTVNQPFRKYASREGSFRDNAKLLKTGVDYNPQIYAGTWVKNANSYLDATYCLSKNYATSPIYAQTLNKIIQIYGLNWLDD